jgi:hypothetical protein
MVTRTYRTAIKAGEDFITIEESVTLPLDASDADIAAAIELGLHIYRAQSAAVGEQVAAIRGHAPAPAGNGGGASYQDAPATEAQRRFIATLADKAGWTSEQLDAYCAEQGADLVSLTKPQASRIIEALKDGRLAPPATKDTPRLPGFDDAPPPVDEADIPF